MHSARELISEATALPVEERILIVDSLLKSLNSPKPEFDALWGELAQNRLDQVQSGAAKVIPGTDVVAKVRARFPDDL